MSELAAVLHSRSPVLAGIRRAEAMALVALAIAAVISMGAVGAPFSFALLGVAAVLLPRRRYAEAASREEQRLQLARQLLSEGRTLRSQYDRCRTLEGKAATRALLEARFEMINWISSSKAQLARYPEFAGIYEAHFGKDLVEEMDGRLHRLSEVVRLAQTSTRLGLPI